MGRFFEKSENRSRNYFEFGARRPSETSHYLNMQTHNKLKPPQLLQLLFICILQTAVNLKQETILSLALRKEKDSQLRKKCRL